MAPALKSSSTRGQADSASPVTTASAWSLASSGSAEACMPPTTTLMPRARNPSAIL